MIPLLAEAKRQLVEYIESTNTPATAVNLPQVKPDIPPINGHTRAKTLNIWRVVKRGDLSYTPEERATVNYIFDNFTTAESYLYLASMPLWDRVNGLGTPWRSENFKRVSAQRWANNESRKNQVKDIIEADSGEPGKWSGRS